MKKESHTVQHKSYKRKRKKKNELFRFGKKLQILNLLLHYKNGDFSLKCSVKTNYFTPTDKYRQITRNIKKKKKKEKHNYS